jgi:hypothetical protein
MTRFAKQGTHRRVPCAQCHEARTAQTRPLSVEEWKRVGPTKLNLAFPVRGSRCFECHSDPHRGNFGTECETCHVPDSFQRITGAAKSVRPLDHRGAWVRRHSSLSDVDQELAPVKSTCSTCHGVPACQNCHRKRSPRSHTAMFRTRTHGAVAGFDPTPCGTCHQVASCTQCHRRTPPLNHRGTWRVLHGYAAGGFADSNCFVCHRRSDCALCHRTR